MALPKWRAEASDKARSLRDQATFELLKQTRELEPHTELRNELTRRGIQAAIDDSRPPINAEAQIKKMEEIAKRPAEKAAVWEKQSRS